MERGSPKATFEQQNGFMSPKFFENPYAYYQKLRDHVPVYWSEKTQSWLVTRHADVSSGLRDRRFSVKRGNVNLDKMPADVQDELTPLRSFYSLWLMYMDPPEHTRIRKLVGPALSPAVVEGMKPSIDESVSAHIRKIEGKKQFDLVEDFAKPLSIDAMARIFGLPTEDYAQIEGWSTKLVGFLGKRDVTVDDARDTQRSFIELAGYLDPVFQDRRRNPKNDLISRLTLGREQGQQLSEAEILAVCANVLIDGHEPIANSIVNGTLAFLRNPGQSEALKDNPALVDSAINEVLRIDPPFQYSARIAMEDINLGDKTVKQGQRVQFMLGAANHDPEAFPDPDTFDITRDATKHAAFGYGSHFCIGAPFGRAVLNSTFSQLGDTLPHLTLPQQQLEWQQSLGYRGLKSLAVAA